MFIFLNKLKLNTLKNVFTSYHILFYLICFVFILLDSITGRNFVILYQNDKFGDLFKVMDTLKIIKCWNGDNPYLDNNLGINFLPPFTILLYSFFALFINYFKIKYLYFYLLFLFIIFFTLFYLLKKRLTVKVFLLLILTYPFLFTIQRGNFAILVFLFLIISYVYNKQIILSIFFLSLAISLKITPIIFILPLLFKQNIIVIIKKLFLLIILTFTINFTSIQILNKLLSIETYNYQIFFKSQAKYSKIMIENNGGLNYGNSLYMPIKYFISNISNNNSYNHYFLDFNPYLICFLMSAPFTLFFLLRSLKKNYISSDKILEFVSISFILFTPVSADYYLLILLIPLIICNFSTFSILKKFLYILILLPKVIIYNNITISSFINPFFLTILLLLIIFEHNFNSLEKTSC